MATRGSDAAAMATRSDRLPRTFGRYLLFDHIGRGGMADIYLARIATELGGARRVVVKQILPELSDDARFARMLIDEAKLVAGLRHANVVQVLDLGREGDRLFIAMEYVEGYDLNQLLRSLSKRRIPLPAEFALFVVRGVLAGLDFAHRARDEGGQPLGIVHRDLSPSNVLISFEGEVKLCDFVFARALEREPGGEPSAAAPEPAAAGAPERSRIAGKAAYMSPEQARGAAVDARSDLFGAGIVLWELCAGRRLYKGSEDKMLSMAREGAVPPLPERGLPEPRALQAILDRALAYEPEDRFESAAQMLRALDDYAMEAKLFASQIRFGAFLSEHFEAEVIRARRERERAAEALARGPAAEIEVLEGAAHEGAAVEALPPVSPPTVAPDERTEPGPPPAVEVSEQARAIAEDTTRRLAAAAAARPPRRRLPLALLLVGLVLLLGLAAAALAWWAA